jgi:hypothetical protein
MVGLKLNRTTVIQLLAQWEAKLQYWNPLEIEKILRLLSSVEMWRRVRIHIGTQAITDLRIRLRRQERSQRRKRKLDGTFMLTSTIGVHAILQLHLQLKQMTGRSLRGVRADIIDKPTLDTEN